jgi:hypothetical protein
LSSPGSELQVDRPWSVTATLQNDRMQANPAAFIYGMIMIGTLLAAESARQETYARTVGAVAIATALYWLVHGYAEFTAHRLREGAPLELSELGRTMAEEFAIVLGAVPPLLALSISWLAGASLTVGVAAAVWADAGMIVIIEVVAGVRADLKGRALMVQTLIGAILGLLIIVLRLVLH